MGWRESVSMSYPPHLVVPSTSEAAFRDPDGRLTEIREVPFLYSLRLLRQLTGRALDDG
jgi:hypothetical protein